MSPPPTPERLREMQDLRIRALGAGLWLATFLIVTAVAFFAVGHWFHALQAQLHHGRYSPKATAVICMLIAIIPAELASRLLRSALRRRQR